MKINVPMFSKKNHPPVRGRQQLKLAVYSIMGALVGALPVAAEMADTLPIERRYYVTKNTTCKQASNATLTLYDGASFGHAHLECRPPSSKKLVGNSYQLSEACRDTEGRGGPWKEAKATYSIISRTEFIQANSYGHVAYRKCPQSDLPPPWSSIDLSAIGIN